MKAELRALRRLPAAAVIDQLNPVIRGQAAHYRTGASKWAFNALGYHMWRLLYAWATGNRRLPPQILLDPDRPARPGRGPLIPR